MMLISWETFSEKGNTRLNLELGYSQQGEISLTEIIHCPCRDTLLELASEASPATHKHHPLEAHHGSMWLLFSWRPEREPRMDVIKCYVKWEKLQQHAGSDLPSLRPLWWLHLGYCSSEDPGMYQAAPQSQPRDCPQKLYCNKSHQHPSSKLTLWSLETSWIQPVANWYLLVKVVNGTNRIVSQSTSSPGYWSCSIVMVMMITTRKLERMKLLEAMKVTEGGKIYCRCMCVRIFHINSGKGKYQPGDTTGSSRKV